MMSTTRPRAPLVLVALAVLLATTACASSAPQRGTAAAPAATAPGPAPAARTPLRIPYSAIGGAMATIWIAKEGGYLAEEGFDVTMDYIATSTTLTQALLGGDAQIAMGGLEALVASNLAGADLVGLAVSSDRFLFRLYGAPGIRTLADLRGKRIAVARHGSTSDTAARLLVRRAGLEPDRDVEMLPAGGNPEIYAALDSGLAQAALLSPPLGFKAEAAGFTTVVDMPAEDIPFHQSILVSTRRYVAEQEDVAQRVVRAYARGVARYLQDREFFKQVLAQYTQLDDDDMLDRTWVMHQTVIPRVSYFRPGAIQIALDALAQERPEARSAKPEDFVDERFLRELDQSGYIASLYR
jgi:NitT/TauT family transport system substrate-binding protein